MGRTFPNPFGHSLCVPYYMFLVARGLWKSFQFAFAHRWFSDVGGDELMESAEWKQLLQSILEKQQKEPPLTTRRPQQQFDEQFVDQMRTWAGAESQRGAASRSLSRLIGTKEEPLLSPTGHPQYEQLEQLSKSFERAVSRQLSNAFDNPELSRALSQEVVDEVAKGVASEIVSYLSSEQWAVGQLNSKYTRAAKIVKLKTNCLKRYLQIRNVMAIVSFLFAVGAAIYQWVLWVDNHHHSYWRDYQAYAWVLMYLPGFPIGNTVWAYYTMDASPVTHLISFGTMSEVMLRISFCFALTLPIWITHIIPGVLVFAFVLVAGFALLRCAKVIVFNLFSQTTLDSFHIMERAALTVTLLLELLLVVTLIAQIYLYTGASYVTSVRLASTAGYCEQFIVFERDNFTWREWAIILSWILC